MKQIFTKELQKDWPPLVLPRRGFDLDPSCKLWLPFYKYGLEQQKIWDQSGNNNHGTISGAVPYPGSPQCVSAGWYFDGVDDYIHIPASDSLNDFTEFTIIIWFQWNVQNVEAMAARLFGMENYNFEIAIYNATPPPFKLHFYDGTIWKYAEYDVIPERKTFLAMVWDGTNILTYIDGVLINTQSGGRWANNLFCRIGSAYDDASCFNGVIYEVSIFNRILSFQEIRSYYELTRRIYGV